VKQVENLAWLIYQQKLNELAFNSNVITEAMYIFAKENLQKDIDKLENLCYTQNREAGIHNGFIENKTAVGFG